MEGKAQIYYWYVDELLYEGETFLAAMGNVTGHEAIFDSEFITTSEIKEITLDKEHREVIITTQNRNYYCPFEYCNWEKQNQRPELIPEYEWLKSQYKDTIQDPTIEEGNVLLVLSNFDAYYFHSMYARFKGAEEPVDYWAMPHIGMYKDSFVITNDKNEVDLRYFPNEGYIQFYIEETGDMPFYIENIGNQTLYVMAKVGIMELEPGQRKRVCDDNTGARLPFLLSQEEIVNLLKD